MTSDMRVFSISVVKNEEDVIAYNLLEALKWSEAIFVLDNGSEDSTWEIVRDLAAKHPRIVAWKSWDVPFRDGLRADVYEQFKKWAAPGDWWCMRLDADEFYLVDPRVVLSKVPDTHHVVCKDGIEYQLTFEDLDEHRFIGHFPEDLPKVRYYHPMTWAEVRFFRHRDRLTWDPVLPFPKHIGLTWGERIPMKHYQYRSPMQMKKRISTRLKAMADVAAGAGSDHAEYKAWSHAVAGSIEEKLMHRSQLCYDDGKGIPPTQGVRNDYLNPWYSRVVKKILHGTGIWP
jgi:hypothetical protein